MRDITELTDVDDPGWPVVLEAIAEGPTSCTVLPGDPEACRAALLQLQVTARSLLGAVVLNSGGLVLADGWLRVYGGSGGPMASLAEVNGFPASVDPAWGAPGGLVVGHDVLGGEFVWNGGDPARFGRPGEPGQIVYFAPDTLEWETLDGGYSNWLGVMLAGGAERFYESLLWPSWQEAVSAVGLRDGLSFFPPLWSKEGREDLAATSRKAVPMNELTALHQDTARQLS